MVLPQGICFCGLWPSFRAFVGPFVGMWGSKSQVLSTSFWRGLHFLRSQGRILILVGFGVILARAARDFFKDFDVLAPKIQKNRWPSGRFRVVVLTPGSCHGCVGPEPGHLWHICGLWLARAIVAKICGTNLHCLT